MSLIVGLGLTVLGLVGWIRPLVGDRWFRAIEAWTVGTAKRKQAVLVGIGLAAVLARLAVLPWQPIPQPIIHDEFSNLLAADTFAHGRLTNPPHPMWIYFDTFHVLQHPTYASKYPPAPGLVLALGQLAGNPWFGTLLTLGLMCAAITWMLQGWFPPEWALLGGVFVLLRLCLFNYWFDAYLGAAIAMVGGAVVLGAFPRILRSRRTADAFWLGVGMVILLLSRPFEGFLFCLPVAVMVALAVRQGHQLRPFGLEFFKGVILPAAAVLGAGLIWLGYYDWRVTGNAFLSPYFLYHEQYFGYPMFVWQSVPPPRHYTNPQFEVFFNQWHRTTYALTAARWAHRLANNLFLWWLIYLGPALTVPFIALSRVVRDRRARLPLWQVALSVMGLASIVWFQPHYTAPAFAAVIMLLVIAMRHLRQFVCGSRPMGVYLSRLVVVLAVDWVLILGVHDARNPEIPWSVERARIAKQLNATPGEQLVLVDYSPDHDVHQEWVSNAADIDGAKIVWARQIPGVDLQPLLQYFASRQVWVVRPDEEPPILEPYPGHNSYSPP